MFEVGNNGNILWERDANKIKFIFHPIFASDEIDK